MDYDRIHDREDNRKLDEKYGPLSINDELALERMREMGQSAGDECIIQYLEGLKDEPCIDTMLAVQDNFGLTSKEVGEYVRMWMDRKWAPSPLFCLEYFHHRLARRWRF